jgi:hypothetical protein
LREVNVKASTASIIGWALMILGFCAIAFADLLACLIWGGQGNGGWDMPMPDLVRQLKYGMAISAVIGLTGIALGWRLRRMKRGVNGGRQQKVVGNVK